MPPRAPPIGSKRIARGGAVFTGALAWTVDAARAGADDVDGEVSGALPKPGRRRTANSAGPSTLQTQV
jgi:hypothetical protein